MVTHRVVFDQMILNFPPTNQKRIQNTVKHLCFYHDMECFAKAVNAYKPVTIFAKRLP